MRALLLERSHEGQQGVGPPAHRFRGAAPRVITQPGPQSYRCAIVRCKDQTVILRIGDHPFLRHDSTIFYGDAMIVDARRLEAEIAERLAVVA